jgi:hypothetical protein
MKQEVQVKAHISIEVDAEIATEDLEKVIGDMLATMVIDSRPALTGVESASFIEEAGIYSHIGGWNDINVNNKHVWCGGEAMEAIRMVLDAATEEGHELSDNEICDAIDWDLLRKIDKKFGRKNGS